MKYFIVSDVHAYYSILRRTLDEKGFSPDEEHTLVLLGDAFDRGDETKETADFLLSLHKKGKLIYIQGNHEDLLVKCLQQIAGGTDPMDIAISYHATNGTWKTLLDLAGMTATQAIYRPNLLVSRVMDSRVYKDLLAACVNYYETDRYIFVHGYIPCIQHGRTPYAPCTYDPAWREASPDAWQKARWYNGMELAMEEKIREAGKTIVCGHWHTSASHSKYEHKGREWGPTADFSPFYSPDGAVIGIDACTAYSHTVNCLVLDEEEL